MFIFIHLIVGLLIGLQFKSAVVIIILAICSHFLLDFIPHWDSFYDKELFETEGVLSITKWDVWIFGIDLLLTLVCLALFFHYASLSGMVYNKWKVMLGAFMSILPDLLKIGYVTELKNHKVYQKYLHFHSKIQKDTKMDIGIVLQLMFVVAFILLMIWFMM